MRLGRRIGDAFFVKTPEVFHRAAAARDNQKIRSWETVSLVKARNGLRNLVRRFFTLNQHRPDQNMAGKTVRDPV